MGEFTQRKNFIPYSSKIGWNQNPKQNIEFMQAVNRLSLKHMVASQSMHLLPMLAVRPLQIKCGQIGLQYIQPLLCSKQADETKPACRQSQTWPRPVSLPWRSSTVMSLCICCHLCRWNDKMLWTIPVLQQAASQTAFFSMGQRKCTNSQQLWQKSRSHQDKLGETGTQKMLIELFYSSPELLWNSEYLNVVYWLPEHWVFFCGILEIK